MDVGVVFVMMVESKSFKEEKQVFREENGLFLSVVWVTGLMKDGQQGIMYREAFE